MAWTVENSKRVTKALANMPRAVADALMLLEKEIAKYGPVRGNWKNYGKLGRGRHHCHVKTGKPTYVAVWIEVQGKVRFVEVTYVGTHENAPY